MTVLYLQRRQDYWIIARAINIDEQNRSQLSCLLKEYYSIVGDLEEYGTTPCLLCEDFTNEESIIEIEICALCSKKKILITRLQQLLTELTKHCTMVYRKHKS